MISQRFMAVAACGAALSLGVAGCGGDDEAAEPVANGEETASLSGTLSGAGSSAQAAAMEAWIAGFQEQNPDATVSYDPVGSGGGR